MKIYLILCLTLYSHCFAQNINDLNNRGGFSISGVSDILSNTLALEAGVVDLARTPDIFGPPNGFEEPGIGSVNGAGDIFGNTNPRNPDSVSSVGAADGFSNFGPDGFSVLEPIQGVNVGSDPFLDGFSQPKGNTQGPGRTEPFGLGSGHNDHSSVGNNAVNNRGNVPPPVSDIHGRIPPHPTGVHVDMPKQHGNQRSFPVLHSGSEPIVADPGFVDFNADVSPVNQDIVIGLPGENIAAVDISLGNNLPTMSEVPSGVDTAMLIPQADQALNHMDNVFHATNVHRQSFNTGPVSDFVDLTAFDTGVGFDSGIPGNHIPDLNGPDVVLRDGPPHDPQVSPNHVPPRQSLPGDFHIDMPGTHGADRHGPPVVHRDGPPHDPHVSPKDIPPGQLPGNQQGGGFHIDMPGTHGADKHGPPIVHRDGPPHDSHGSPNNIPSEQMPGNQQGGGFHIDMPGTHGADKHGPPVVHRDGPPHDSHGSPNNVPSDQMPGNQLGGGFHIDMPGTHGADKHGPPVVHRDGPPHDPRGSPNNVPSDQIPGNQQGGGGFHIDMPGTHGADKHGPPVVHRDGPPLDPHGPNDVLPGPQAGTPLGGFHIDMPGEHQVPLNGAPQVHRDGPPLDPHLFPNDMPPGQQPGTLQDGFQIDQPGTLGADQLGPPFFPRDGPSHIPDQQGSPGLLPGIPIGPVHKDMSGLHDIKPNVGHVTLREGPSFGQLGSPKGVHQSSSQWVPGQQADHGIHNDSPLLPGNPFNGPTMHLPPGSGLDATNAAGVIPHLPIDIAKPNIVLPGTVNVPVPGGIHGGPVLVDKPVQPVKAPIGVPSTHLEQGKNPYLPTVVPTGVLPGTPNVPVPSRPRSLGEMLGIETADAPVHLGSQHPVEPSKPIDNRPVIIPRGRGYTGRRRGDSRERSRGGSHERSRGKSYGRSHGRNRGRSRGRGRAYGRRGGRGGFGDMHVRSNPFGHVGNVLQSALTRGGPGGGGLLGSLVQTALGAMGRGRGVRRFGPAPGPMIMISRRQPLFT